MTWLTLSPSLDTWTSPSGNSRCAGPLEAKVVRKLVIAAVAASAMKCFNACQMGNYRVRNGCPIVATALTYRHKASLLSLKWLFALATTGASSV